MCCTQDDDGEEEMDDELQDETEEEFDGDQVSAHRLATLLFALDVFLSSI